MSSAKNHARRSRRGYHIQKSITGGYAAKVWVHTAEKRRQGAAVDLFRRMWNRLTGKA